MGVGGGRRGLPTEQGAQGRSQSRTLGVLSHMEVSEVVHEIGCSTVQLFFFFLLFSDLGN